MPYSSVYLHFSACRIISNVFSCVCIFKKIYLQNRCRYPCLHMCVWPCIKSTLLNSVFKKSNHRQIRTSKMVYKLVSLWKLPQRRNLKAKRKCNLCWVLSSPVNEADPLNVSKWFQKCLCINTTKVLTNSSGEPSSCVLNTLQNTLMDVYLYSYIMIIVIKLFFIIVLTRRNWSSWV